MQRVPGNRAGLTPKTATAEYFSKWRSSASVARGVGLDAMGNEFMAKAVSRSLSEVLSLRQSGCALVVQDHVQQGAVNFQAAAVVVNQTSKFVHEEADARTRRPIISASVSWLIFAITAPRRCKA
jgi:hypothetical protein